MLKATLKTNISPFFLPILTFYLVTSLNMYTPAAAVAADQDADAVAADQAADAVAVVKGHLSSLSS